MRSGVESMPSALVVQRSARPRAPVFIAVLTAVLAALGCRSLKHDDPAAACDGGSGECCKGATCSSDAAVLGKDGGGASGRREGDSGVKPAGHGGAASAADDAGARDAASAQDP